MPCYFMLLETHKIFCLAAAVITMQVKLTSFYS